MVGAGFSRNVYSIAPEGTIPPTLQDLARAIIRELYPESAQWGPKTFLGKLLESGGFLSLAQEYENAFGKNKLHQLLKCLIRDNNYIPTGIHERLLRLPWRDVFTTNWDTLLEKTSDCIPDYKYNVVRIKDEIPLSNHPRIVKLHGSFPANFPLICTQEDYRTYPAKFAPFVNTVQQAMMETVFMLIGFSGDDPNFIHWTGWVRDNLRESAPKIYLAGWLNLSLHRRRMLEQRNVVSIDLARHPKANEWPEHQRHDNATEWILHTLERGRPYLSTDWPSPSKWNYKKIPDLLQPVVPSSSEQPLEEPDPGQKFNFGDHLGSEEKIATVWAHNRKLYPGWLTIPISQRRYMGRNTNVWEPMILKGLHKYDAQQQLEILYELIWRRETLLDPILTDLESAAEKVLQRIDCKGRTIDEEPKGDIEWITVRANYRNVALALVTTARFRFDYSTFEERLNQVEEFRNDASDVSQRLDHERCLWAMYSLDYRSLSELLGDWSTENCDPIWMIRKAVLLYETNQIDDAQKLTTRALSAIRRIPDDSRSVSRASREGWSLMLAAELEAISYWVRFSRGKDTHLFDSNSYKFNQTWRELAPLKCDAKSELGGYENALTPANKREITHAFDFGFKTIPGFSLSSEGNPLYLAAYRTIRLSEVVGLPAPNFPALKLATDHLSIPEPEMAIRLILRACDDKDELLSKLLSRPRIAEMPVELVDKLINLCNGMIEYALPRIGFPGGSGLKLFWTQRGRVAMEVLSRLVVRINTESVEKLFHEALGAYNNATIIQEHSLHPPVRNMLKRSWNSLTPQRQTARFLDLLSALILGKNSAAHTAFLYPDPQELFRYNFSPPDRTEDNESRWQQIVSQLVQGLKKGGEVRERSFFWVLKIKSWERLTEQEAGMIAQVLWSDKSKLYFDLTEEFSLDEWVFIVLPQLELGLAEQHFRDKWLSDKQGVKSTERELANTLMQVGLAIYNLKICQAPLTISGEERSYLVDVIGKWLDTPMPDYSDALIQRWSDPSISKVIYGMSMILSEIKIPIDLAEKLYQKMMDLNNAGIPAFGFIPGLSMALPDLVNDLTLTLRTGLIAHDSDLAGGSVGAVQSWLYFASDSNSDIEPPPNDLIREVGKIIATRRTESLKDALLAAKWIFDRGTSDQKRLLIDLALDGLKYLSGELRYDRGHGEEKLDKPYLRWGCVRLALSMAEYGLENDPTIRQWLEIAETDPLPEVRHAITPTRNN